MSDFQKRIMLIIPYGGVGGMERLALNLYHHYREIGHVVKVVKLVRLSSDIVNFGSDEIALSEVDLAHMSPLRRYSFYLGIPFSLARIVRRFGITHSIAFGDMANLFSSVSPSAEFKVASIHSTKSLELSTKNSLNRLFRLAYKSTYKRFESVICISQATKNDLVDKCGFAFPAKLVVSYNPHDFDDILIKSNEEINPVESAHFDQQSILFLGRISPAKAPWHLVNAFRSVLSRGIKARLLFIGDGDTEVISYLQEQLVNYGMSDRVVFLGRRENPYKYLARADILALSSHYEGTPNVIVEAIALGVPVVSSRCTEGIPELMSIQPVPEKNVSIEVDAGILTPNLYQGVLGLPVKDAETSAEQVLADALAAVLSDGRHRERLLSARDGLLEKFNLAKSAGYYLASAGHHKSAGEN